MLTPHTPLNLSQFRTKFRGDRECYEYLFSPRSGMPFSCPRKGCHCRHWTLLERTIPGSAGKRAFRKCKACGHQESATAGTVFHGSRLALKDWFQLFWWAASVDGLRVAKLGAASAGSMPMYFGSAATPYRCVDVIRRVMGHRPRLSDVVRVGLMYVGPPGSGYNRVGLAVSERKQEVRLGLLADFAPQTIGGFLKGAVEPGTRLITCDWDGFAHLTAGSEYLRELAPPVFTSSERALQLDFKLAEVSSDLHKWLSAVGWSGIRQRNFAGYLAEFGFRYACRRKGSNRGYRFKRLICQALQTPR